MKSIFLIILSTLTSYISAQDGAHTLNISFKECKMESDTLVYITAKIVNNSNKKLILENPDLTRLSAFNSSSHWQLKTIVDGDIFYPYNSFMQIDIEASSAKIEIDENKSYEFDIPIDLRSIYLYKKINPEISVKLSYMMEDSVFIQSDILRFKFTSSCFVNDYKTLY